MTLFLYFLFGLFLVCTASRKPGFLQLEGIINKHHLESSDIPTVVKNYFTISSQNTITRLSLSSGIKSEGRLAQNQLFISTPPYAPFMILGMRGGQNYKVIDAIHKSKTVDKIYTLESDDLVVVTIRNDGWGSWYTEFNRYYDGEIEPTDIISNMRRRHYNLPVAIIVFRYVAKIAPFNYEIEAETYQGALVFSQKDIISIPPTNDSRQTARLLSVEKGPSSASVQLVGRGSVEGRLSVHKGIVCIYRDGELDCPLTFRQSDRLNQVEETLDLRPNDIVICIAGPNETVVDRLLLATRSHLLFFNYQDLPNALTNLQASSQCQIKVTKVITPSSSTSTTTSEPAMERAIDALNVTVDQESETIFPMTPVRLATEKMAKRNSDTFELIENSQSATLRNDKNGSFAQIKLLNPTDAHITTSNHSTVAVIRSRGSLALSGETFESIYEEGYHQRTVKLYPGDLVAIFISASQNLTSRQFYDIFKSCHRTGRTNLEQALTNAGSNVDGIAVILIPVEANTSQTASSEVSETAETDYSLNTSVEVWDSTPVRLSLKDLVEQTGETLSRTEFSDRQLILTRLWKEQIAKAEINLQDPNLANISANNGAATMIIRNRELEHLLISTEKDDILQIRLKAGDILVLMVPNTQELNEEVCLKVLSRIADFQVATLTEAIQTLSNDESMPCMLATTVISSDVQEDAETLPTSPTLNASRPISTTTTTTTSSSSPITFATTTTTTTTTSSIHNVMAEKATSSPTIMPTTTTTSMAVQPSIPAPENVQEMQHRARLRFALPAANLMTLPRERLDAVYNKQYLHIQLYTTLEREAEAAFQNNAKIRLTVRNGGAAVIVRGREIEALVHLGNGGSTQETVVVDAKENDIVVLIGSIADAPLVRSQVEGLCKPLLGLRPQDSITKALQAHSSNPGIFITATMLRPDERHSNLAIRPVDSRPKSKELSLQVKSSLPSRS